MGGCNTNNCSQIISSSCVSWQGASYEDLQVCIGDTLTEVTSVILDKIRDFLKGRGIILEDITLEDCEYLQDMLGVQEKSLINLLDVFKQAICDLQSTLESTSNDLEGFINVRDYLLGFLTPDTPCGDPATFRELIQGLLDKVTALDENYTNLALTLKDAMNDATGDFLLNAITSAGHNGISYSGQGSEAKITFTALVPPYCPILFTGPANSFDITGKGYENSPYRGWLLCNGNNGTPNSTTLPQNAAGNLTYIIRFN